MAQAVIFTALPGFAAETVIYDDFTYEETTFRYEGKINDNWAVIAPDGSLLSNKVNGRMNGEALEMTGIGTSIQNYRNRVASIGYTGDYSGIGDTYRIKFHFDKDGDLTPHSSDTNVGYGVRFANDFETHSYYLLWFNGSGDGSKNIWSFNKILRGSSVEATVLSEETFNSATATTNGGGIIMSGDVEIVVSGGSISWTVNGLRYGDFDCISGGSYYDSNPFTAKGVSFAQSNGSSTYTLESAKPSNVKVSLTDDFTIENVEEYTDFEPVNVLYKNIGEDYSSFDAEKIRRICVPASASDMLLISFTAEDGSTAEKTVKFDSDGWWVNLGDETLYTGIAFEDGVDLTGLVLLTDIEGSETDAVLSVGDENFKPVFPRIGNTINMESYTWVSKNEKTATVSPDGGISGINRGNTVITVSKGRTEYKINLTVKGEIDTAFEEGTIDEYLADKKPVIDELNRILEADDENALAAFLINDDNINTMLAYIKDIDRTEIQALADNEPEVFKKYVKRLLTYGDIVLDGIDDINALQELLDTEIKVGAFNGIGTAEDAEAVFAKYEDEMGFNKDNEYYGDYKGKVYEAVINKAEFLNKADLQSTVKEAYVMSAFKDAMGYKTMVDIAKKCAQEIGYDEEKFNKFESQDIGSYLLGKKNSINSTEELKEAIDGFVPPKKEEEEKKEKKTSSGGSGGSGGGRGISISNDIVQEAAKPAVVDNTPIFTDVSEKDWFYTYVRHLKGTGVLNGYADGGFHPLSNISRAEFIKTLVSACGLTGESEETEFIDVSDSDWFSAPIKTAAANGIFFGSGGKANPNAEITREEMAAFLYRTCKVIGMSFNDDNAGVRFTDDSEISDWAYVQVIAVKNLGLISGYGDGSFRPRGKATRAEAMTLVSKFKTMAEEGK